MGDTVTTRLHIGGLTPQITPDHLRDRFKSFGNVKDVETLADDALGESEHCQNEGETPCSWRLSVIYSLLLECSDIR